MAATCTAEFAAVIFAYEVLHAHQRVVRAVGDERPVGQRAPARAVVWRGQRRVLRQPAADHPRAKERKRVPRDQRAVGVRRADLHRNRAPDSAERDADVRERVRGGAEDGGVSPALAAHPAQQCAVRRAVGVHRQHVDRGDRHEGGEVPDKQEADGGEERHQERRPHHHAWPVPVGEVTHGDPGEQADQARDRHPEPDLAAAQVYHAGEVEHHRGDDQAEAEGIHQRHETVHAAGTRLRQPRNAHAILTTRPAPVHR